MKKALLEIIRLQIKQGVIVNMSISQKQSNSGIKWNQRLLVLIQNQSFGYFKNFKLTDEPSSIDISKIKQLIPIKNIFKDPTRHKDIVTINFFVVENGKSQQKQWLFKMSTQNLANQWVNLLKSQKNKIQTKRHYSKQTPKKVQQIVPLKTSILQQEQNKKIEQKPQNAGLLKQPSKGNIPLPEADHSKVRIQKQKDFKNPKYNQNAKKPKQYENLLYETQNKNMQDSKRQQFILKQQLNNNNKSPQPPQNVARKLNFTQDDYNLKRTQKQQQERLKEQREQLRKKERQLAQKQRKIKQEQQRLKQQKKKILELHQATKKKQKQKEIQRQTEKQKDKRRDKQIYGSKEQTKEKDKQKNLGYNQSKALNQNKEKDKQKNLIKRQENDSGNQVTVINQKFFLKDKQSPQRQQLLLGSPKTKPKLQGVNYSDIVNKVILSKNNEKGKNRFQAQKNIQEEHEMLLQLQKLKIRNKEAIQQQQQQEIEQQIQKQPKQADWTYKFLKSQFNNHQFQVINQFKQYCSNLLRQVVQQLHLPQKKRSNLPKYKREQFYTYQKDSVQFKIAMIGLKQIFNKDQNDRDKVCDQKTIKMLQKQFRNFHILYRTCRQLQTKSLKIPLCCLCQYQGFVAFFKAKPQFQIQNKLKMNQKIEEQIQKVSQVLHISSSLMKNKQNVLIIRLNTAFYGQIAVKNKEKQMTYDYFMPDEITNLLPIDNLFNKNVYKESSNPFGPQPISNIYNVRAQLLTNKYQMYGHEIIFEQILTSLKKTYRSPKALSSINSKNEIDQNILIPISFLIKQLDNLDFYFITPRQLQVKLHENGINMRYLGLIYQQCALKFQKCYLMSQIAARVCKALFRKTIQDVNIQQTQETLQNNYYDNICMKIIDFLNCIMGSSIETVTIWKVLSIHSIQYFNIPLNIQDIQKGYFVNSLIYHCGIQVDWTHININSAFFSNQFFNQENFIGIKIRTKIYQPILNNKQKLLLHQMEIQDPNAIKILQQQYKIQTKALPQKLKTERYLDYFRKYLTNFVPPDYGSQRGYKFLNLYSSIDGFTTKNEFYLKFMELKWQIKRKRKQKYVNAFSDINSEITSNFGDFHPLLSQLYDIMCLYHRNNGQYQDAITFSKSSVINMLKVCGANHPKVGQSYFQLATCCIKGGKKQQAIISLQKAKNIFQANNLQGNLSYAHVCLKLGLLFLSESKTKQSEKIVKYALSLFNKHYSDNIQKNNQTNFEEERVQCLEILSRCYELDEQAQDQIDLSLQCQKLLNQIKSPHNLQKMLKIILSPLLGSLSSSQAAGFLDLITKIPLQISVNTYMKGYNAIKQRISKHQLVQNLQTYLLNIKTILSFINQNNSLKKWRGLEQVYQRGTISDFISLTEELIYFLGEGFVTGSIRDSL